MYRYRLTVQTTLPSDYERDGAFRSRLEMLAGLGFWGLELNVADPAVADFERISRFLGEHGLEAQIRESFEADIRHAVRRLAPILE